MFNNTPSTTPLSVTEILNLGTPAFEESLISWRETIENVAEVFGKMHINLYETMFTNESMSNLFSYLEIPYTDATDYTKEDLSLHLSEDQLAELFTLYPFKQENYDYAVSRFGKEFIDRIWTSSDEMNFSRKIWSFGNHPEFSDVEKQQLYEKYPFMRENYDFAVSRFGKEFINSIWWNPYK